MKSSSRANVAVCAVLVGGTVGGFEVLARPSILQPDWRLATSVGAGSHFFDSVLLGVEKRVSVDSLIRR